MSRRRLFGLERSLEPLIQGTFYGTKYRNENDGVKSSSNSCRYLYSMFHVTWITFKFNRNKLGTVSAYVMRLWLVALLMCTLE